MYSILHRDKTIHLLYNLPDLLHLLNSREILIKLRVLLLTHTGGVRLPEDRYSLPLAGSAVGDEGLTVAVFMDRTLTHICHTRPDESRTTNNIAGLIRLGSTRVGDNFSCSSFILRAISRKKKEKKRL